MRRTRGPASRSRQTTPSARPSTRSRRRSDEIGRDRTRSDEIARDRTRSHTRSHEIARDRTRSAEIRREAAEASRGFARGVGAGARRCVRLTDWLTDGRRRRGHSTSCLACRMGTRRASAAPRQHVRHTSAARLPPLVASRSHLGHTSAARPPHRPCARKAVPGADFAAESLVDFIASQARHFLDTS